LLFDVAAKPDLVGHEALALLRDNGCVRRLALLQEQPGRPPLAISTWRWTAQEALAARGPAVADIPLGRAGDRDLKLVAEVGSQFGDRQTFAAVRRLVHAARSLDNFVQEEKRRTSLWAGDPIVPPAEGIFASAAMSEIFATAIKIAPTNLSILLTGETGTGKEVLARAIHRHSGRADRPFLPFNCSAVPKDMLDSQLFGHRRGAFTGAVEPFGGVVRAAAGGTLFLDEIGELGAEVQPKLLRFLETREVHPIGESQPSAVDVRVMAATNADLERLVSENLFREDLYYRLNVVRLRIPPLRERREEIPPLIVHFLERYAEEMGKRLPRLADETHEYLLLYNWPGNVRQLGNEIRRLVAFAEPDTEIRPELLSVEVRSGRRTIPVAEPASDSTVVVPLDQTLAAAIDLIERAMIGRALTRARGRLDPAAKSLGLSRKGLYLKRLRLGLAS
jgi:DNA-binding NtrC family response regulator